MGRKEVNMLGFFPSSAVSVTVWAMIFSASFPHFLSANFNPHCAESPILAMKKNIFDKFQPILG
jgi:hypothetical protein